MDNQGILIELDDSQKPDSHIQLTEVSNSFSDDDDDENLELLLEEERDKGEKTYRRVNTEEQKKTPEKTLRSLDTRRLLSLAKPEILPIILGTIALILASGSFMALPLFVGKVIDQANIGAIEDQDLGPAKNALLLDVFWVGLIVLASSIFATFRSFFYNIAGERVVARLRRDLFSAIISQEIGFFDETKTGELVNRLASDCTVVQNTVTVNVSMGVRSIINFIVGIGAMFLLSWQLCFVILGAAPFIVLIAIIYGRFIKKLSKGFQEALAQSADNANEAISLIRTVRSFSKEEFEMDQYGGKVNHSYELARKKVIAGSLFTGGVAFFGNITMCGVLYLGGYLVMTQKMSPGDLTSFVIYALSVATALGTVTSLYGDFMNAVGASERVFQLIDRVPKVNWKGGERPSKIEGRLKMEDVHFRYPTRSDVPVLNGIDLTLTPGKIVALVGPSGGGKSTIASLLEVFYHPTQGRIILDDMDITKIDPQILRKHIGIVSQEPMLFGASVLTNITYGKPEASFDEAVTAAKMSNAHQFISAFPDGYDTVVGERGLRLSGGQKQRVAIARALLLNPSILLLDEATSALDAESEHLVQQALDTLMKGRTVLVIAHRLSTVKNADQVCVVHNGKIIERGTHDELIVTRGMYAKLVKRQLQKK